LQFAFNEIIKSCTVQDKEQKWKKNYLKKI
jgi:hypothetical protein